MFSQGTDTICAVATPTGMGGIGVIRISGPAAFVVCDEILRHRRRCAMYSGFTIHRAQVMEGEEQIDDVLVSVFHAPRSYTGEDLVELSCHGGPVVLGRVLGRLLAGGARHADPGEFTLRAYLNGKMDLAQAEAVCDVVSAKTNEALRLARNLQSGRLSRALDAIRDRILGVLARVEASIDFPEDVGDLDEEACRADLIQARDNLQALLATATRGILTREGARVVLVGRPNAGKSSLMNALLRTDRALVTDIPGTTRDMIEETMTIHGIPIRLQDTAGLRTTNDLIEAKGIAKTQETLAVADLVLFLIDGTLGLAPEDAESLALLEERPRVLIWNKCDLEHTPLPSGAIAVSAVTQEGMNRLEEAIFVALTGQVGLIAADAPAISHTRHLSAVRYADKRVTDALTTLDSHLPADLLSVDLQGSLEALGTVLGQTAQEDIIAEIFSRFCIGK